MDNWGKREGNSNQNNSRNRERNTAKSKSNLQAIQRHRRNSQPKKPGKPKKELSEEEIKTIKEVYGEYRCNAIVLQKILKERGYNIGKNKIHEVLKMLGYAKEEKSKKKRKKWVRYESILGLAYRLVLL